MLIIFISAIKIHTISQLKNKHGNLNDLYFHYMQISCCTGLRLALNACTLKRPLPCNYKYLFPSNRQTQGLPPVMPQEKAHKQGTSCLPVFKDDSYGMQNHFLHTRLNSPFQTSGCSSACSCIALRAKSATTELSNTVLSHSSHSSGHNKENLSCSFIS